MKLLITALFLSAGLAFFISCGPENSPGESYFNKYGEGDFLFHTVLDTDSLMLDQSPLMMVKDKIIFSDNGNYSFMVFTVSGDSLLYDGRFQQTGRGAYEMNIPKLGYDASSDLLYVYAPFNKENKCFSITPDTWADIYDPSAWNRYRLPVQQSRLKMELVNDSVFINIRKNEENNLFSLTYKGKDNYFKNLDFPYPDDKGDIAPQSKALLYNGEIRRHPAKQTYLYTCEAWKLIFIFDLDGEAVSNVRYISREEPLYKPVSDGFRPYRFPEDSQMGCLRFFVTAENIYLGYNPLTIRQIRNMETYKGYPSFYIDNINVFNWDGSFVKRLVLDMPVSSFIVSPDNMYLYGASLDMSEEIPLSRILRFNLKEL